MSYNKKIEEWREAARRKAQEIDERFELRNKIEQGVNAAGEAARKGAEIIGDAANTAREQANKLDEQFRVTENLRSTATQAGETIRSGARVAQEGAEDFSRTAEEKAREIFGDAQTYYRRAEQAYNLGTSGARITEAALTGYEKARVWSHHPRRGCRRPLVLS